MKTKITRKIVKSKSKSNQDKHQCKTFEMGSSKMSRRTRNVQRMKFYEAFKKNPSDENEIFLKNYWIDRKNKKYLTSSRSSPRKDKKGAQDIVVKVTKKVSSKFGETVLGGFGVQIQPISRE